MFSAIQPDPAFLLPTGAVTERELKPVIGPFPRGSAEREVTVAVRNYKAMSESVHTGIVCQRAFSFVRHVSSPLFSAFQYGGFSMRPLMKLSPNHFPTSWHVGAFLSAVEEAIERLQGECSDRELKRVVGLLLRDAAECLASTESQNN